MVKVISLSDKAYGNLRGLKTDDESFSDVVLRLVGKESKHSILEFAGVWKGHGDLMAAFKMIKRERKIHSGIRSPHRKHCLCT